MTKCIRIDVDGTITRCVGDAFEEANKYFPICSVVTLAPKVEGRLLTFGAPLVGWIDDVGRFKPLSINKKAWVLYGRSPIVGTMFVCDDSGADLKEYLINYLEADVDIWTTEGLREAMSKLAAEEGLEWVV